MQTDEGELIRRLGAAPTIEVPVDTVFATKQELADLAMQIKNDTGTLETKLTALSGKIDGLPNSLLVKLGGGMAAIATTFGLLLRYGLL